MTESDNAFHSDNSRISSERVLSAAELLHNTIRFAFDKDDRWTEACNSFPEYQEKFGQLREIITRRHQLAHPGDKAIEGQGKVGQIVGESQFKYVILNAILINRLYSFGILPAIDKAERIRIVNEAKFMREEAGEGIDEELKIVEVLAIILEGKLRID